MIVFLVMPAFAGSDTSAHSNFKLTTCMTLYNISYSDAI